MIPEGPGIDFFNLIENLNKIEFFSIRIEMQKKSIFSISVSISIEMDIENFQ